MFTHVFDIEKKYFAALELLPHSELAVKILFLETTYSYLSNIVFRTCTLSGIIFWSIVHLIPLAVITMSMYYIMY